MIPVSKNPITEGNFNLLKMKITRLASPNMITTTFRNSISCIFNILKRVVAANALL
ncbi:MAG TPA: hypothetical protein VFC69_09265 [Dysgonamonadaceae bacterium]|nr:hypothetical protein [Dysgonamonadaceae bacterium]